MGESTGGSLDGRDWWILDGLGELVNQWVTLQCMTGWVDALVVVDGWYECYNLVDERVSELGSLCRWISGWLCAGVSERVGGRVGGCVGMWMIEWVDKTDVCMGGWICGYVDRWVNQCMDDGWVGGCDGCIWCLMWVGG